MRVAVSSRRPMPKVLLLSSETGSVGFRQDASERRSLLWYAVDRSCLERSRSGATDGVPHLQAMSDDEAPSA